MNHASKTRTLLVLCACGMSALAMSASARTVERLATGVIDFVPQFNGPADVYLDKVTLEPLDTVSYHTHPGDSVNVVTQGTVTLTNRCSAPTHFSVGETFVEAAEVLHTISNEGSEPAVFFAEVVGPGGVVSFAHNEPDCSIQASLKPSSLGFGLQTVNTRQTQSFNLRNTGTAPLTLLSLELTGRNAAAFRLVDACGSVVEVGASCLIKVIFRPFVAGPKSATLRVLAADNADSIVFTRDLTGRGCGGTMTITVNGISYSIFTALVLAALTSCGGSGNGGDDGGGSGTTYTIGGSVTGLDGPGLVLQVNGGGDLTIAAEGSFTFATRLASGAAYEVTVRTQPASPLQDCVVNNGSGTLAAANVTDVAIACTTTEAHTIGGSVSELTGSGLVLQNNGSDDLAISASGAFTFATPVASGSEFSVTVKTQPSGPAQTCSVGGGFSGNGTGTVGNENVEYVRVACGLHLAYATNAGDDTISAYAIAAFTGALTPIGTPVATGTSPYAITGSPDKRHVYVVNRTSNDIWAYSVNAARGVLTPIPTSPIATGTDPQALAFDPSGGYLYVANHSSNNLSAFAVNAGTGALTPLPTATYATGTGPSAVSVDDSGKFVFVANNGGSNNISVFAISSGTGALTEVVGSPFPADRNPHSLAIAPTFGTYLYTANVDGANSSISGFAVNTSTGALTKLTGSPFPLEVSNYIGNYQGYGDSLFVTTAAGVVGYFAGGSLTTFPSYSAVAGTNAYSVTSDQRNSVLYVANDGAASISAYKIDDVTATLTEVPGSPFPAGNNPKFIAIL